MWLRVCFMLDKDFTLKIRPEHTPAGRPKMDGTVRFQPLVERSFALQISSSIDRLL